MADQFSKLEQKVLIWGAQKGILNSSDPKTQALKFFSEAGELADAIAVNNTEEIVDALGDVMVTLILLSELLELDLVECLEVAYAVIAKRNGSMVNGIFVKDND